MSKKIVSVEFAKTGFVTLPYPADLRRAVLQAIESWKEFCKLPNEVKKGLPYNHGGPGVGYELKEGVGPKADRKENFDVSLDGQDWLLINTWTLKESSAMGFLKDSVALVTLMRPLILAFAHEVEEVFRINGFAEEVNQSYARFFVRFIHYFGNREIGEETATAHVDQSAFTLHLFESAPGLQCLTYDKQWIDMPVSDGETVIIPAMQLQLRSEGELKALCHRVVAVPETADQGRYSAVCFVQLKNTPKYDKEKWGRLQEKESGFNYDMDPKTFSEFFK
jgi:isopenicillin N synthase-like dioxygenase